MAELKTLARHQKGSLSVAELEEECRRIWLKLIERDDVRADLANAGLARTSDGIVASPYVFHLSGQGLTAADVLVDVSVGIASSIVYDALRTLWLTMVLPRILKKMDDGIGPEE